MSLLIDFLKNLDNSPAFGGGVALEPLQTLILVIFQYLWPEICQNRLLFYAIFSQFRKFAELLKLFY